MIGDMINNNLNTQPDDGVNDYIKSGIKKPAESNDNKYLNIAASGLQNMSAKIAPSTQMSNIPQMQPIQTSPIINMPSVQPVQFNQVPQFNASMATSDKFSKWKINKANNELNNLLNDVYQNLISKKRVK